MSIKLIAIDLDGTLLNDNEKILNNSIKAIAKAQRNGIKVVLCTGRPLVSVLPYLKQLHLDNRSNQYVITFNGSVIETTAGKVIKQKVFDFQTFVDFELWADNINLYSQLECQSALYTTNQNIPIDAAHESWKNKLPMHVVSLHDLIAMPTKPPMLKIMAVADRAKLDQVQQEIPQDLLEKLNPIRSEPEYLDFAAPDVDKGWALEQLTKYLGLSPQEVMAIGNADNDLPMVKYAGIGVAMEKSTPHLLRIADYITGSNNTSGIADVINAYI
ncbi:Cof-type HAD-IIB family hydrolase [Lactobacillus crispatus]|jgi:cof-like hydrolase|uniref:Cof-type HAD-IIB family hydrolase n=1 Tax=Lactobacillus crispatus TaxID=47770 RepID=A0A135ZA08_9LACO|nr:Cof-type HAD-IIB family hydrolase [Lactobacillus crispatus]STX18363.1 Hydrolase [Lactobacillus acidophilus]KXI18464.1 Cof-like hydrolase [Lactobacillus crispatus]MCT7731012.1 Cof-type HAD-IIB family hydrolase [Lactobacillus crispatus]MCT7802338.1 Cof-type HAD-IIB family hydrolase [Lactobacillus crispatus]MCT7808012.1 Cof-type HAD-IIB family hydrolase [Lactobacillus crispatus]